MDLYDHKPIKRTIDAENLMCHASLYSADKRESRGLVYNPSTTTSEHIHSVSPTPGGGDPDHEGHPIRNLLGSVTTQARLLRNELGELGMSD